MLPKNPSLSLTRQPESMSRIASVGPDSQTSIDEKQSPSEKPRFPPETIAIRISGLRNKLTAKTYGNATFSYAVRVPSDTPMERLGDRLLEEQPSK